MHELSKGFAGEDRYPGYDVLSKRNGVSWNEQTRRVITRRLAVGSEPKFFTAEEFKMVIAVAGRLVPQPRDRAPIPVAALVDRKLHQGSSDGYREVEMPRDDQAWRLGLEALDAEANAAYGRGFHVLPVEFQDSLLGRMEQGELKSPTWGTMRPEAFFKKRMARDIVLSYYAHPTAWSEIGWGGPASPRGYVRLDFNERDPWEAAEAGSDDNALIRRINRDVR